jgi:plastocyanin
MRLIGLMAAVGAALVMVACGGTTGGGGTSSTPTPAPTASPTPSVSAATGSQSVTITETEFKLDPATVTVKPGSLTVIAKNGGQFSHDLHIVDSSNKEVGATSVLAAGASGQFTATLTAGTYTMFCAIDSHRARGMEGKITVQ